MVEGSVSIGFWFLSGGGGGEEGGCCADLKGEKGPLAGLFDVVG